MRVKFLYEGDIMSRQQKMYLSLAFIFAVNIVVILLVQSASADLYKKGMTDEKIKEIQTRLSNWGYYSGTIDGIYGSGTEKAVRSFQQKNGLTPDGQVGNQTLAALGIQPTGNSGATSQSGDIDLLARLISAESRGEPYEGQVAVGAVVLNRIKHPSFPNSLSGVIYQPYAFTCVDDGQFDKPVAESAYRAAKDAMNGWDPSGGAIYYYNPRTATSSWIYSRPVIVEIGEHLFCS